MSYSDFDIINDRIYKDIELNYSLSSKYVDVWDGFKRKEGDKFPDKITQDRARLYEINRCLYTESISSFGALWEDYYNIVSLGNLNSYTEVIRCPYYKYITDSWVSLILGNDITIDINSTHSQDVIDTLNDAYLDFRLQEVLRSLIQTGNAVLKVNIVDGSVTLTLIPCTNWIPYIDKADLTSIKCNEIFNVYTVDSKEYIEFVCFIDDGTLEKYVFEYNGNTLGKLVSKEVYNEYNQIDTSSVLVFTLNKMNNDIFGKDEYRYWESSILEILGIKYKQAKIRRKSDKYYGYIPKDMTLNLNGTQFIDTNRDLIYTYDNDIQEKEKDVKIEQLDVSNLAILKEMEDSAIKRLSIDCGLGITYFDTVKASHMLSGTSQEIMMKTTLDKAKLIYKSMTPTIKEIVKIVCRLYGDETSNRDIKIKFNISTSEDYLEIQSDVQSDFEVVDDGDIDDIQGVDDDGVQLQ